MRIFLLLLFIPILVFCRRSTEEPVPTPTPTTPMGVKIDVLALGDSYTIGERVKMEENFPNQLVDSLKSAGFNVTGLKIVARTGWRTDDLQDELAKQSAVLADSNFSLVTLCIGVNNQFQNANFDTYKKEFEELLNYAIARAGGNKERVVVISIPDWAYTTFGQGYGNPANTSAKIDQYNAANLAITQQYDIAYVNVTDVSRRGLAEPDLVAIDGLHPSAKQYTAWVQLILPVVKTALKP